MTDYCDDFSGLPVNSCGHCLGHTLDPELEPVAAANLLQGTVAIP